MPSVARGVGVFFALGGAPSAFLGRPRLPFSATGASSFLSAFSSALVGFFAGSFFCFLLLSLALTVLPSAFSSKGSPALSSVFSSVSPFFSVSSCFLLSPVLLSLFSSFLSSEPEVPLAFSSTLSSEAFLTTSLPERSTWTAGLPGSAFFLILLPFLEVMAISPSVFFSATVPPGWPLPQFHVTRWSTCQRTVHTDFGDQRRD